MLKNLAKTGCTISKIYFYPHRPDENCDYRKPKPGLLIKAIKEFNIQASKSWFIGDDISDVQAANQVGVKPIQIEKNGSIMRAIKIIQNNEE